MKLKCKEKGRKLELETSKNANKGNKNEKQESEESRE
jgi:hypothetical protein